MRFVCFLVAILVAACGEGLTPQDGSAVVGVTTTQTPPSRSSDLDGGTNEPSAALSPEKLLVPGGTLYLGSETHRISDFRLDKHEVTVARYRAFTAASTPLPAVGAGQSHASADVGWESLWSANVARPVTAALLAPYFGTQTVWTDVAGENENKPMVGVTWYEAQAFCVWDGGRLPTENEWTLAYLHAPIHSTAGESLESGPPNDPTNAAWYSPDGVVEDVAKFPASAGTYGHEGMYRGTLEWVLDVYAYERLLSGINAARVEYGPERVVRGQDLIDGQGKQVTRYGSDPVTRSYAVGFRCQHD